jgi:hypothetical protein
MTTPPLSKIEQHLKTHPHFYLSITGLKIRGWAAFFPFWWHAVRSKIQADSAPGLIFSDVKKVNGIQHTLTAWENQEAMKKYIYSGAHMIAIKVFRKIATGKTFGYETNQLPSWDEVHDKWNAHGREYYAETKQITEG